MRLGHLHVVAVDGHIWTGIDRGSFERQGIEFETTVFDTGPEVFEAMAAGKLDVLSGGGVIADYLPRGHGRLFLINDIEIATAQLWVRPDLGVKSFADLKGKRIVTTRRTTAHIFLDRALRANNLTPSDVEIVSGAHERLRRAVHCRRSAGRRTLGAVQHQGAREVARRGDAGRRLGLLSAVGSSRRLGRARGLL